MAAGKLMETSIGNDIVDFGSREKELHPRFADRVLSAFEKKEVDSRPELIWTYWAAKEAAFKAVKRLRPETVFSPAAFEVDIKNSGVTHRDISLACRVTKGSDYVHAICATSAETLSSPRLHNWIAPAGDSHPSEAVRVLAIEKIPPLLKADRAVFAVSEPSERGVPPLLLKDGTPLPHLLSFSHHGSFVSCCFFQLDD